MSPTRSFELLAFFAPVSIRGIYQMLPRIGWQCGPGPIEIRLAEPVRTGEVSRAESRNLVREVRETIIRNCLKR